MEGTKEENKEKFVQYSKTAKGHFGNREVDGMITLKRVLNS
jgi:hypothetical protein